MANRKVLAPTGRFVIVGGMSGNWLGPLIRPIGAMLISPFVDQEFQMLLARLKKEDLEYLADVMRQGKLKAVIDSRFPLSEVPAAIRHSEDGHAQGKIVINPAGQ